MNFKDYLEKHKNGDMNDAEWERLAQSMMNAQFDQEKRTAWEQQLAQKGISRTAPKGLAAWPVRKLLAAASIVLVAAVGAWMIWGSNPLSDAQKMAGNYLEQPFRLDQGNVRGGQAVDVNRGRALEAFNNRQYENALQYLQLVEADGQAKAADFFQMGLCLIYQQRPDYQAALNTFNAAKQIDPAIYTDEINWFSALCHLMLEDKTNARTFLQKVIDSPSSRNRGAAEQLLKRMDD